MTAAPRPDLATTVLVAGEASAAAVLAHAAAGGHLPHPAWLLGFAAVVAVGFRSVRSQQLPAWLLFAGLVGLQAGWHWFLHAMAPGHAHGAGFTFAMVVAHLAAAAITVAVWRLRSALFAARPTITAAAMPTWAPLDVLRAQVRIPQTLLSLSPNRFRGPPAVFGHA